jgi:hypothetical protein
MRISGQCSFLCRKILKKAKTSDAIGGDPIAIDGDGPA